MIAHLGLLNNKITNKIFLSDQKHSFMKHSFQIFLNILVIIWTWQLTFESIKKYWKLVEYKRDHLARFNIYFNFVHSLLNIIRRLKLASLLPGQWDRRQSCKYNLGTSFGIISQNFLIACHKSFGHATITHHNRKHVLWCTIAARLAFYSQPSLYSIVSKCL